MVYTRHCYPTHMHDQMYSQLACLPFFFLRCVFLLLTSAGGLTRHKERDSKPTSQIHHTRWIVLLSQPFQLVKIITVKILHVGRLLERRTDEIWETFRRGALRVNLFSEFLQRRLHGVDPIRVVFLALPREVHDDRAVGLGFFVRPGRGGRILEHVLGKRPHADADTRAAILRDVLGSFLEGF